MDGGGARLRLGRGAKPWICGGTLGDQGPPERSDRHHLTQQDEVAGLDPAPSRVAAGRRDHRRAKDPGHDRSPHDLRPGGRWGAGYVVESALRQSEFRRLYDPLSLQDFLGRYRGHRGVRSIRAAFACLAEAPGPSDSWLEDRFLPFLDRHDLPRPHLNAWLSTGGRRFKVDCLWPVAMQIVELDGWEGHGTRTAFRDDRARDRKLRVAGYGITRIPWSALDHEPEAVASDLRSLLLRQPVQTSVITYRRT